MIRSEIVLALVLLGLSVVVAGPPFGQETNEQIPFNVLIFNADTEPFCNGIAIEPQWIIAPAHCIRYDYQIP